MKRSIIAITICTMLACGITNAKETQQNIYTVRTLAYSEQSIAIVKLNRKSGDCWLAKGELWSSISKPKALPEAEYDMSLTKIGSASWIITLWNTFTGNTYIYSSSTGNWRSIVDN